MGLTGFNSEQINDKNITIDDLNTINVPSNGNILIYHDNNMKWSTFIATPTTTAPTNGAIDQKYSNLLLQASAFVGIGTPSTAQFQITLNSDTNWTSIVYDSGEISYTNEHTVPTSLNTTTSYKWRVRYKDDTNNYSNWMIDTQFTTKKLTIYDNQTSASTDKCLFYCKLNSLNTTTDEMGNLTDGVLGSGTTTGAVGKIDEAVDFDGTSNAYISFSEIQSLGTTDDFSMSAWFKVDVLDSTGNCILAFDNGSGGDQFYIRTFNNVMRAYPNGKAKETTTVLDTTNYHNVVVTYNGTSNAFKIYIDGTLDFNGSETGFTPFTGINAYPLYIGKRQQTSFAPTDGKIDCVAIWNKEIPGSGSGTNQVDVAKLWNSGNGNELF